MVAGMVAFSLLASAEANLWDDARIGYAVMHCLRETAGSRWNPCGGANHAKRHD